MKSRAVVAWEAGKPLVIEEVEVAAPKAGEVLLKIAATTLPGITSSTAAPAVSGLGLAIEVNVEDGNFAAGSASGFNYFIVGPRILFRF